MKNWNWKQITFAVLIGFFIGFFAGTHPMVDRPWGRHSPEKKLHRMLERLSSKLQLSPEQKTQVKTILEDGRKKMHALKGEARPRFEEIRTQTNAEIRKLLTPEQLPAFEKLEADWEARMRKRADRK